MFNGKRFSTRCIAETVPTPLQAVMWMLIDAMTVEKDYICYWCKSE